MGVPLTNPVSNALALEFISRSETISPSVLRLGGGSKALTINELETAIVVDPEFSLRALALANSAFYSQQHEINSLRGALVVLGVDAVHNLAASLLAQALHSSLTVTNERLWEHCQAVGVAAQILSEAHRQVDSKQAFAAGLLHDIGILALQVLDQDDVEAFANHAALGADIAEQLGLSHSLITAIRYHDESADPESENTPLKATIYIANELAELCGYGIDLETYGDQNRLLRLAAGLDLKESDLEALTVSLPTRLQHHHATLDGSKESPA